MGKYSLISPDPTSHLLYLLNHLRLLMCVQLNTAAGTIALLLGMTHFISSPQVTSAASVCFVQLNPAAKTIALLLGMTHLYYQISQQHLLCLTCFVALFKHLHLLMCSICSPWEALRARQQTLRSRRRRSCSSGACSTATLLITRGSPLRRQAL